MVSWKILSFGEGFLASSFFCLQFSWFFMYLLNRSSEASTGFDDIFTLLSPQETLKCRVFYWVLPYRSRLGVVLIIWGIPRWMDHFQTSPSGISTTSNRAGRPHSRGAGFLNVFDSTQKEFLPGRIWKKTSFIGNSQFLGKFRSFKGLLFWSPTKKAPLFKQNPTHGRVGERFPLSIGSPQRTIWMVFFGLMFMNHLGVSQNSGFSPQIIHFERVFHYKPSILGYPYFREHPFYDQHEVK